METNPLERLAQKFLIDQLTNSNQFLNDVLFKMQSSLIEKIPSEKLKIEQAIASFQHPFNSCSSLINVNSRLVLFIVMLTLVYKYCYFFKYYVFRLIKLPVSVQLRENGHEQKVCLL